ncbi:MAG: RHS repeat-associated core domain-containing protein [Solirubrobacteraceae bacterium]|jgi:hypothetical protein
MGARVYDPYTGTFTQPDPIQGGGATPYGYTDADPVNQTDLTGDAPDTEAMAAQDQHVCTMHHSASYCDSGSGGFMGIGDFVPHNYGTIAQVAAGTACLAASGGTCAVLLAGGLTADTVQNYTSGHFSAGREAFDVFGAIPGFEAAGLERLAVRSGSIGRAIGGATGLAPVRRLGAAVGLGTEAVKKATGR